ncbi:MAG: anaerobic ribonucleoside-triphosphate reductase [Solobacterium sp.]|nr:anaerobic ribonucleoside-triphosphate reductase [Solobacterium sp.]
MIVIKRSGEEVEFDASKIENAVRKANEATIETGQISEEQIRMISQRVVDACRKLKRSLSVEEIQDMVETEVMAERAFQLAHNYITYRYERALVRKANTTDKQILSLIGRINEEAKQENSNKNPTVNSTQRDYMAGEVSKDITRRFLLPPDIIDAHEKGIIHFHDADYFAQPMYNCCLVNLDDMLQNGTVISETAIEKPHSFATACNIATQIIAQVASNQYGGQTITLAHLAPFVEVSRQKHRRAVAEELAAAGVELDNDRINHIAEQRVRTEIKTGVQTMQYQIITLMTTNGQAPFVTVYMYLDEVEEGQTRDDLALIIEETLNQRILGVKNEKGVYITPAFPKLIYALDEDNIHEDSKYFYLTKLAAQCTAKRMVPDYISAKVMRELKGEVYPCMGCRSFLTPDRFTDAGIGNIARAKDYAEGKHRYYGRFNQGVVTLNLVDIACSSEKDPDRFWKIFDERLELCHRALMIRHNRLLGTPSDVAPILWQHGAIARLEKGELIDRLLYNGYSTISLGYGGLSECVYYMTGKSHTSDEGREFGLRVMKHMNDACAKWKKESNIDFSVYGTPMESTTYKFAKCLQERFGVIEHVTDKNYITNSYHIHVQEEINAFDKLTKESAFQQLSPGGAISYVEVPNMQNNIPAVLAVMKHIYNTIMYAELNTKSDYCQKCGFDGEIQVAEDKNHKLIWKCPNCGNTDQNTMNVARRTCGYIGTQFWNQGRTQEIKERVLHLSTKSSVSLNGAERSSAL